jgi:hypothetical protein
MFGLTSRPFRSLDKSVMFIAAGPETSNRVLPIGFSAARSFLNIVLALRIGLVEGCVVRKRSYEAGYSMLLETLTGNLPESPRPTSIVGVDWLTFVAGNDRGYPPDIPPITSGYRPHFTAISNR